MSFYYRRGKDVYTMLHQEIIGVTQKQQRYEWHISKSNTDYYIFDYQILNDIKNLRYAFITVTLTNC